MKNAINMVFFNPNEYDVISPEASGSLSSPEYFTN